MEQERIFSSMAAARNARIAVVEQALDGSIDTGLLWDVLYTLVEREGIELHSHDGSKSMLFETDPDQPMSAPMAVVVEVRDPEEYELAEQGLM